MTTHRENLRPVPGEQTFKAVESPMGTSPEDEALRRSLAEAAMRPYLPLLRWVEVDGYDRAELGEWRLFVTAFRWDVVLAGTEVRSGNSGAAVGDRKTHRRAAEAALRALGVVFRVEGE
jgi:hypothetical protein